jgi:hypothetical protein
MAEVDTQKLANVLKENRESAEKAAQSAKEDRLREMEFRREEIEKLKNIAETGRENGKFISKQVREDASSQVKRFNQQQNLLDKVTGLTEEQRMDRDSRKSANDARQEALNKLKEKLESLGIKADDNYQVNKEQKEINKENLKLEKKSIREKVRDRLARARDAVKEAPKALVTGAGKAVAKTASGLFDLLKKLFGPALIFGVIISIMKFLQSEENREKIKEIFEKIKAGFKFVIEKILIPLGPVIKAILEFSVATIVAGFEGIKKVMGFIQDFAENGPKPEEYKGLPVLGLGVTTTLGAISKSAKNADSTIGKIAKAFNTAFFGTAVPGPGGAGATKGGVVNYIRSFFRPLKGIADGLKGVGALVTKLPLLGLVSNFFVGSAKAVGGVAKAASPFLKLLGKLFLPLTIIIGVFDTIKGAISGFKEDDEASLGEKILNAIQGGLTGLVNSIIGIPLDLVVSLINFVAKKFGFEDGLIPEDMKPSKLIKKLIALPFDALKAAIDFVKGIFTDPVGTIKSLFYGLFGEEGILNFLVEPLEPVFNFIKKIFSFDFMGFIKKIPGVGKLIDFFTKDEAEKLAEIEEDIAKAEAKIAEARDRMERSEGGENVYYGDEEYKRAQDAKYIAKLEEEIAKAKAKELEITTGSKEPIIVNQDNSTNDNSTNSSSTSVTGKSTTPLAYSDAYYVIP